MNFIRFLFSLVFLRQIGYAIIAGLVVLGIVFFGLDTITENNDHVIVPDIEYLAFDQLPSVLEQQQLRVAVLDSAKFNVNYPPLAVIEQNPKAGSEVKRGRKIYVTLNPSGYRKLKVPDVIQITKRNAETRLIAVGFEVGELLYRDNIGKDMVLEIRFQGEKITPGITLPKTSKIDLVLGNGKR